MVLRVRFRFIFTVLLSVFPLSALPAASATHQVCQPAGTCAYDTIQTAISAAANGDIVLVHDGTYESINFSSRTITVQSVNGPGETTIDGGGAGSVVVFSGGEGVLRGFTITNGAVISPFGDGGGGGVYVAEGASPVIDNCIVRDNTAPNGAGIFSEGSLSITGSIIESNSASNAGGGIQAIGRPNIILGKTINIIDSTIRDNDARYTGGGLDMRHLPATITGTIIEGNSAGNDSGGLRFYSYLDGIVIEDSTIEGNTCLYGGSGGADIGGVNSVVRRSVISSNRAFDSAGGIWASGRSGFTIEDSTISGNSALFNSGGGLSASGPLNMVNCTVTGNFAHDGGGLLLGWLHDNESHRVVNTTLAGNRAIFRGGGVYHASNLVTEVSNSILWFNSAGDGSDTIFINAENGAVDTVTVTYSNVQGGWAGEGNIEEDPLFTDPRPASTEATSEGDYSLTPCSPCIDAGTAAGAPGHDIDGDPRPFGAGIDMGADESLYGGPVGTAPVAVDDFVLLDEDSSRTFNILANDSGNDPLTLSLLGAPAHGELQDLGEGAFTYVPSPNFNGEEGFYYLLSDGLCAATARVRITVNPLPDPPFEVCGSGCPSSSIQEAIDAVGHGDTVLVHPGTYQENIDFTGKNITVRSAGGPETTVIDGSNPAHPAHGSVVKFGSGEGRDAVLEGFTLTGGSGTRDNPFFPTTGGEFSYGGGVYCRDSSPTIRDCRIGNGSAAYGGGIYILYSSPLISGSTIENNIAEEVFGESRNWGGDGGGIYSKRSNFHLEGSTVRLNTAMSDEPSNGGKGGGIYLANGSALIESSRILSNLAHGMSATGGGISSNYDWYGLTIRDSEIRGNKAEGLSPTTGGGSGGGLYSGCAPTHITNTIVSGNSVSRGQGGGIYLDVGCGYESEMVNSTVTGNAATSTRYCLVKGGGVFVDLNDYIPETYFFDIVNSIIWGNVSDNQFRDVGETRPGTTRISFSDVYGLGLPKAGNFGADPLFVAPISASSAPTEAGDFHLREDSPCIDRGINAGVLTDIDGNPRPMDVSGVGNDGTGNEFDMGSYEFPGELPVGPYADFTADPNHVACGRSINFNGSGSYHRNPARRIVQYEWDFDYDGLTFTAEGTGRNTSHVFTSSIAHYVALRVTDDDVPARTGIAVKRVLVGASGNSDPIPDGGGPYSCVSGGSITLDASDSYIPVEGCGTPATTYRWDLNNDGVFGDSEGTQVVLDWVQIEDLICGGSCDESQSYHLRVEVTDQNGGKGTGMTSFSISHDLFADDFSDGFSGGDPDWYEVKGIWKVLGKTNKAFVSDYRKINKAVCSDSSVLGFSSGQIETLVKMKKPFRRHANGRLIFGYQDPLNYRFVELRGGRTGRISIGQKGDFGGDSQGVKASRQARLNVGRKWHHLRLDLYPDGTVNVFLANRNGDMTHKLTHTFPAAEAGQVGYQALRAKTLFDDFVARDESVLP